MASRPIMAPFRKLSRCRTGRPRAITPGATAPACGKLGVSGTTMDGSQTTTEDAWTVAGRTFRSRLIVGTGKYKDYALNAAAAEAAGAEMITVALRRVNLSEPDKPVFSDFVRPDRFTGEEAVRTLRLAREAGGWDLVKLEVLTNTPHLYPDMEETLRALKLLIADG